MTYSARQVAEDAKRWRDATDGIADAVTAERLNDEERSALLSLIRHLDGNLSQEDCNRQIGIVKKNYKYHPVGDRDSKLLLENLKAFVAICAKYFTKTDEEFQLLKVELKGSAAPSRAPVASLPVVRPIPVARFAPAASPIAPLSPPPTYLLQSVACLVFCCFPFAIPAIFKGAQVNKYYGSGDYAAAQSASDSARLWMVISLAVGILLYLFIGIQQISTSLNSSRTVQRPGPQSQTKTETAQHTLSIGEILTSDSPSAGQSVPVSTSNAVTTDSLILDWSRFEAPSGLVFHPVERTLEHRGAVLSIAFSLDSSRAVTASVDHTARVWESATGQPVGQAMEHSSEVKSASFISNGEHIVTEGGGVLQVWEAKTGNVLGPPLRYDEGRVSIVFCPNRCHTVTAGKDDTARVWKVDTGEPVGEPLHHGGLVNSAEFSPDGRWIVTASEDRTAQFWQASTGKRAGTTLLHENEVQHAAFTPDGRRVVTITDEVAHVWDVATGEAIGKPMSHGHALVSAVPSPDGLRIATADQETVRLWEVDSGRSIGQPLRHKAILRSASFSPDGRMILSCIDDIAQVWNAETGESIGQPLKHAGQVTSAVFSPNGRWIATSGFDNTAKVWKVPSSLVPTTPPNPLKVTSLKLNVTPDSLSKNGNRSPETTSSVSKLPEAGPPQPHLEAKIEEWTDLEGRMLKATLIRVDRDRVFLKDAEGKELEFRLAVLSPESRKRALDASPSPDQNKADAESAIFDVYEELYGRIVRGPDLTDVATAKLMASANGGNHEAEALVGESFYDGIGTFPVNRVEALKWFVRAAKGQNSLGRLWIAVMTRNGEISASDPPQTLFQQALPDLAQIIAHQNPIASYWRATAECYAGGEGVPLTARQPRQLLEKAIERDDPRARLLLGNLLIESNSSVGAAYLRYASDARCATASTSLAKYYLGQSEEMRRAPALLRIAAFKNDLEAQILLGTCLATGKGTDPDPAEAAFWLETGLMHSIRLADKRAESLARGSIQSLRTAIGEDDFRRARDFLEVVALTDPAVATKNSE